MAQLKDVLITLLDAGGSLVDTAPTYGDAETVLSRLLAGVNQHNRFFLSTKISVRGSGARQAGIDQMTRSEQLLGKAPLDLILVHNLSDLETQWQNLVEWKAAGRVRYIGITVSQYSLFDRLEQFMRRTSGVDFVQLNYSMLEPRAGDVLIPLAVDQGAAVMVNRPFGNGGYFTRVGGRQLPDWAAAFDCESWGQFSLKWILADERVTCVIPATSNPRHMLDNARAGYGRLPDAAERLRISEFMQTI
jgi:diketogulonate reductase-like aldo/keto reductase